MAEGCGCEYHPERGRKWKHCRDCGAPPETVGRITGRGRCFECSIKRATQNMREMAWHSGPAYEAWGIAMQKVGIRAAGGKRV